MGEGLCMFGGGMLSDFYSPIPPPWTRGVVNTEHLPEQCMFLGLRERDASWLLPGATDANGMLTQRITKRMRARTQEEAQEVREPSREESRK